MGEGRAGRRTIKSMEKYFFNEIYEYPRVTNLLHKHWEKIPDPVPSVSMKFQMTLQFPVSSFRYQLLSKIKEKTVLPDLLAIN